MSFVETGTILDKILARTAADVAARKLVAPVAQLERLAAERPTPVSFGSALTGTGVAVIAEFKRASPSKGRFPVDLQPDVVAQDYFSGGASAMSVLTDEPFFQGSLADLRAASVVAHSLRKPGATLRKDFVVDEYQILEALAFGADALLLIVAALEQAQLEVLLSATASAGLAALVEVHDDEEMLRAASAGATILGINNRDLKTFQVDLATTERLARLAPAGSIVVGESGIFTPDDVRRMHVAGAKAVLVGESVMTAGDRAAAVHALATAVS